MPKHHLSKEGTYKLELSYSASGQHTKVDGPRVTDVLALVKIPSPAMDQT